MLRDFKYVGFFKEMLKHPDWKLEDYQYYKDKRVTYNTDIKGNYTPELASFYTDRARNILFDIKNNGYKEVTEWEINPVGRPRPAVAGLISGTGIEILNGHHRCSMMCALGHKTIPMMLFKIKGKELKDMFYQDGIKVENKLRDIKFDWKDKSVLDLGCNIGLLGNYVTERGAKDYTGVDRREGYIIEGRGRNPDFKLEIGDLVDYVDYPCDVLVILAILHHLEDKHVDLLLSSTPAKEMVCEIPCGKEKVDKVQLEDRIKLRIIRDKQWYIDRFEKHGWKIEQEVVLEQKNEGRVVFVCTKI